MADSLSLTPSSLLWGPGKSSPVAPPTNTPLANSYKLYNSGVNQNAEDYSGIMKGYQDLLTQSAARPLLNSPGPITPQTYQYQPTSNFTGAVNNLQNLSQTGGYSDADVANLRARAISPIRSIYSSAQQNVDRQRALQGGYSPNYGAVQAKLARDLSSQIGDATTNVNAQLAQNIAQNKLSVAPELASATGQENQLNAQTGENNANTLNQVGEFNAQLPLQYASTNNQTTGNVADILRGMTSLYGTTPALSNLFGSQAMQSAGLQNQITQQGNNNGLALISQAMRGLQ